MPGVQLQTLTAGAYDRVFGTDAAGTVHVRDGVTSATPGGTAWTALGGHKLTGLDAFAGTVFGVQSSGAVLMAELL